MTEGILQNLALVEALRSERLGDRVLSRRVQLIKTYQQLRFKRTYADLLVSARYGLAATFFLDELYGPGEFAQRDAQFARVVPKLGLMMPGDVMSTVHDLARLHAISEALDSAMARCLERDVLRREDYIRAWQQVGRRDQRELQLQLVLDLGKALDGFTRRAWIMAALRMMRGPAHAAGLASLQTFLESGLSSFRSMKGAAEFLDTVSCRETRLINAMFEASADAAENLPNVPPLPGSLGDLPTIV